MKVASINVERLTALCNSLRQLKTKKIPAPALKQLVEAVLIEADAIRRTDVEYLVCLRDAAAIRGCAESTIYHLGKSGHLTVYSLCHKDYFDRREVEKLPAVGTMQGKYKRKKLR